jgi:transcriptional regulator with XRE-family HTH domain
MGKVVNYKPNPLAVGDRVRLKREALGMDLLKLAELSGVGLYTLRAIEKKRFKVHAGIAGGIARALQMSMRDLL